ncbi:hypothetical protein [Streptomyces sp. IBSBF 2435]|uniref:hypothetical protein n=1 Tax=Streptomyces sp. IBSBF 2435 TaxID=2903531 RepID=UPI002FDC32E1
MASVKCVALSAHATRPGPRRAVARVLLPCRGEHNEEDRRGSLDVTTAERLRRTKREREVRIRQQLGLHPVRILNYSTTCPAGWSSYLSDCYWNSPAVAVPSQPIANLAGLSLSGAVATQMGADTVAVCASRGLMGNGNATSLTSGGTLSLPSGDTIVRTGSQYAVTDPQGDSMTATMNPGYVDVHVGLGTYPQPVSGLPANAPGTNNQLRTSTGTVIRTTLVGPATCTWGAPQTEA